MVSGILARYILKVGRSGEYSYVYNRLHDGVEFEVFLSFVLSSSVAD